ncbi:GAF domain-containing protein [Streptomyces fuscigenes]|uniref:GAF domain-containing protein n=1 Tax=Streptomyces fuscigenes TaxID=1528880 RepID=UPI001F173A78|nr:GAF domain-containing protein [Streptomyces fuscigenes]MCF3963537.1 GAF domain-containing protein [Streptomyces fuscigenes]
MTYDPIGRMLITPEDRDGPERVRRLRGLGLGERPEPAFDALALRLARLTGAPYAGVNFLGEHGQFFAGLHTPHGPATPRGLARSFGFCPHVVARRKALVLEDVRDFPRFAANPLVDGAGIRSYLGAPVTDRTGVVLGTVCAGDTEPRRWGREGLDMVKSLAGELAADLHRREEHLL